MRRYAFPAVGFMAVLVLLLWVQNLETLIQRPSVAWATTTTEEELVSTEMSTEVAMNDEDDGARRRGLLGMAGAMAGATAFGGTGATASGWEGGVHVRHGHGPAAGAAAGSGTPAPTWLEAGAAAPNHEGQLLT